MADTFTIRVADAADLPRLREMEQGVIEAERPYNDRIKDPTRYYDLESLMNEPSSLVLVGEREGQVLASGYVQIRDSKPHLLHDRHGYLGFMYVTPNCRGRGFNRAIIRELMAWCSDRGVDDFYLDVYAGNEAAIRAYEKLGFRTSLLQMKYHCSKMPSH